jgi:preprotein translocase subunit SecG
VIYLLETIHILVCIFLIMVVLLQQGKGADLSVFGGGTTQTAFGARGATTLLHKLTVASFVIFILTTISIAVLQNRNGGGSLMHGVTGRSASTAARKAVPAAAPKPAVPAAPAPGAPGRTPR